jgi:hypothetical protein
VSGYYDDFKPADAYPELRQPFVTEWVRGNRWNVGDVFNILESCSAFKGRTTIVDRDFKPVPLCGKSVANYYNSEEAKSQSPLLALKLGDGLVAHLIYSEMGAPFTNGTTIFDGVPIVPKWCAPEPMPPTVTIGTRSIQIRLFAGEAPNRKIADGVEVRGSGFVLLPPSMYRGAPLQFSLVPSTMTAGAKDGFVPHVELPEVPEWFANAGKDAEVPTGLRGLLKRAKS